MAQDLYQVLGLSRGATDEEIKKAYRRLAKQHHPDLNPGNKGAEDRFKEVSSAFDVLGDSAKRKLYDEFGEDAIKLGFDEKKARAYRAYRDQSARPQRGGGGGGFGMGFDPGDLGGADLEEILEMLGRSPRGGGFGARARAARPSRGEDLTTRARVSLAEAVAGTERSLRLARPASCQACGGEGTQGPPATCPTCGGTGRARVGGGLPFAGPCPTCRGTGKASPPCPVCGGSGVTDETQTLTVRIPPGVHTGSQVRLAGQGAAGRRGGAPGDLFIEIEVAEHPLIRREGDDLHLELPITVPEAVLGAEIRVPTFEGEVTVTVPPGSQSGRKMRLRGKGVPNLKGGGRGDLYLNLRVVVPDGSTPEIREAAERLAGGYAADVREGVHL